MLNTFWGLESLVVRFEILVFRASGTYGFGCFLVREDLCFRIFGVKKSQGLQSKEAGFEEGLIQGLHSLNKVWGTE